MFERLPVVAAIPNYNMGEQLETLLHQLVKQDYADIYVLDDASTDGSRDIVEGFGGIQFVGSPENRGAGATRNLVIGALGLAEVIIHFVDADTDLETEHVAEVANYVMPIKPVGFIGGLAKKPNGTQSTWNYGPRQCLRNDIGSQLHSRISSLANSNPERAKTLRKHFNTLLADWPDILSEPERRQVFWNIEQNLLVNSDVFAGIGGFDETLREHEIQDLAIRLHKRGLKRYFDPAISVRHKDVKVRGYNRDIAMGKAEFKIAHKHGFLNYLMPDGRFNPSL